MELDISDSTALTSNQDVSVVTSLVGEDGVMVLKLIGANSSELLVRDVVCGIAKMARGGASASSEPSAPAAPPLGVYPSIQPEKGPL